MALVVGCDPSSKKLSFYGLHPILPTVRTKTFTLPKARQPYRPEHASFAMDWAMEAAADMAVMATPHDDKFLFLEAPVVGRGGVMTTMVQSFISGPVQGCFVKAGYTVYLINNNTWKAWYGVTSRQMATVAREPKEALRYVMKQRFPKDVRACGDDGDLIDAAAIARYGAAGVRGGQFVAVARSV